MPVRGVTFWEDKLDIKPSDLKSSERMRATLKQCEREEKQRLVPGSEHTKVY